MLCRWLCKGYAEVGFCSCRSANAGKYSEAIVDFEAALTINHTHKNARKYLVDAQVSYGEEYVCVHMPYVHM